MQFSKMSFAGVLCCFFYVAAAQCSMEIIFDVDSQTILSLSQEQIFLNLLHEENPRIIALFEGEKDPMFFDILPEKGLARITSNQNREINRLDLEKLDFHQKVYEGYKKIIEMFPNRIKVINADQPLEKVFFEAESALDLFWKETL